MRERARSAREKDKRDIFSIFSHLPTPNPRASGQSITVFIFLRALLDIYSEHGRCMKVYPANLLVHDMKFCLLGEQREVTQEPHAKRGACARKKKSYVIPLRLGEAEMKIYKRSRKALLFPPHLAASPLSRHVLLPPMLVTRVFFLFLSLVVSSNQKLVFSR